MNISRGPFYDPVRLDVLIRSHESKNGRTDNDKAKLEGFLKTLRVKVNHRDLKRNENGESVRNVRTIFGLATNEDGEGGHNIHLPRVQSCGGRPKEVEFYHDEITASPPSGSTDKATGKATGKLTVKPAGSARSNLKSKDKEVDTSKDDPDQKGPNGGYISVYQFFIESTFFSVRTAMVSNYDSRLWHIYQRSRSVGCQFWKQEESDLSPSCCVWCTNRAVYAVEARTLSDGEDDQICRSCAGGKCKVDTSRRPRNCRPSIKFKSCLGLTLLLSTSIKEATDILMQLEWVQYVGNHEIHNDSGTRPPQAEGQLPEA